MRNCTKRNTPRLQCKLHFLVKNALKLFHFYCSVVRQMCIACVRKATETTAALPGDSRNIQETTLGRLRIRSCRVCNVPTVLVRRILTRWHSVVIPIFAEFHLALVLVRTEQQPVSLLTHVVRPCEITNDRYLRLERLNRWHWPRHYVLHILSPLVTLE